ncbi:MAG: helix-turn-helix domain-containing protein [Clostridiales bacterium]|nr:helix-turn-helix domain-containing protein [Clostridiales bacterium]
MIENSSESKKILAKRLKEVRKDKELSQTQFVDGLSMTASTLSSYEQSKANPSMQAIVEIALKHNLSIDWLFGLTDNPENKVAVEEKEKYKLETLADIGSMIIALLNSEIAEGFPCNPEFYNVTDNKINIKFSIENNELYAKEKNNMIAFRSESDEFNDFFNDMCSLRNLLDGGGLKKEYYDLSIKTCIEKLKGITIKSLLN